MLTKSEAVAYVHAMVACAQAEIAGMQAYNAQFPNDQPYSHAEFVAVIEKYGIHHNAVIGLFQESTP